jgi:hypothetical protein
MRGFFIHSHYCVIVCEVARKSFFAATALQEREERAYACAFFLCSLWLFAAGVVVV